MSNGSGAKELTFDSFEAYREYYAHPVESQDKDRQETKSTKRDRHHAAGVSAALAAIAEGT